MKLNTSALRKKQPPPRFFPVLTKKEKRILLFGAGISAVLLVISWHSDWIGIVLWILFMFVCVMLAPRLRETQNHWRFRHFAQDNGFRFKDGLQNIPLPPLKGDLDTERQDYDFHMTGTLANHVFTLFVGNFRRSSTVFQEIWVLHTQLPAKLPSFVVDARHNTIKLSNQLSNYDKLHLEGDFPRYFHLYIPKGTQVDVLSVITPDVMQTLKKFWQYTDVVVKGENVWLLGTNEADDDADVQNLFDSAAAILPELNHRARTYRKDK